MNDPYQTLGVERTASQDDIRRAYRKLAKNLHPDLHPGNKEFEARFKEVSAAYKLLSDSKTRERFDRGEIDASGAERASHNFYRRYADTGQGAKYFRDEGFADDIGSVFAEMFGQATRGGRRRTVRAPGADVSAHLTIDFLEAAKGAKKRVTLPEGRTLDITVPAGVNDGQTLRLKGQGRPGLGGGRAGDLLIEIRVRPHPLFKRRGNDIDIELPVTLDEAVLGAKIDVPTIDGPVTLTVPKGSNSGTRLRLKGRGVKSGGKRGDQYVTLKVVLPEKVDPELEELVARWAKTHPYDPRRNLAGVR